MCLSVRRPDGIKESVFAPLRNDYGERPSEDENEKEWESGAPVASWVATALPVDVWF